MWGGWAPVKHLIGYTWRQWDRSIPIQDYVLVAACVLDNPGVGSAQAGQAETGGTARDSVASFCHIGFRRHNLNIQKKSLTTQLDIK